MDDETVLIKGSVDFLALRPESGTYLVVFIAAVGR